MGPSDIVGNSYLELIQNDSLKKKDFSYYDGNSENKYKLKNKILTL